MATFVCRNCVGDSYLRGLIDNQGMQGDCEYCDADELVVELDWLADQVKTTLESHFVHTSPDAPRLADGMVERRTLGTLR